jgi:predicted nucleic acid-binding Zn ribbon protein
LDPRDETKLLVALLDDVRYDVACLYGPDHPLVIVHPEHRGAGHAGMLARAWAVGYRIECEGHPADWGTCVATCPPPEEHRLPGSDGRAICPTAGNAPQPAHDRQRGRRVPGVPSTVDGREHRLRSPCRAGGDPRAQDRPMTRPANATGVDLARLALRSALAAARDRAGDAPLKRTRTTRSSAARADDRDPRPLGGLFEQLLTERGWAVPVTGGSIADAWPRACPEYAEKVTAGHYDPDTGRLDLHPASITYATQLRLLERALIKRVNAAVGTGTVRSLRVIPPGGAPGTPSARTDLRPRDRTPTLSGQRRDIGPPAAASAPRRVGGDTAGTGAGTLTPAGPPNAWARALARARRERLGSQAGRDR